MIRLALRGLLAHRLRLGLTAMAVVLGVCFVSGTLIFRDTMARSFDGVFDQLYDEVQVIVRAEQAYAATDDGFTGPVPHSVADTIERAIPRAVVEGSVEGYAAIVGSDGEVVGDGWKGRLGGQWEDHPESPFQVVDGSSPRAPDEVVVDSESASEGRLRPGDSVDIVTEAGPRTMRLSGVFTFGPLSGLSGLTTYVAFTPSTAAELLLQNGSYSSIMVYAEDGTTAAALRDRVAAVLPAGFEAVTGQQELDKGKAQVRELLDLVRVVLLAFAAISVFVGSFIIFNTFSMLVAQRTRELALLRAVGAGRRQVTRIVLVEAFGVGLVGSTVGIVVGALLAAGLRALSGTFGVSLPSTGLVLTAGTVAVAYLVGVVITVLAAFIPARRAARVAPVAALRDDVPLPPRTRRLRLVAGVLVLLLGAAIGLSDRTDTDAVGFAMAIVLVGVVLLGPAIAGPIAWLLGRPYVWLGGAVGRLATRNARRHPRRTAATAAALMIGMALVSLAAVLSASTKASVDRAFDNDFGAAYVLKSVSPSGFSPRAVDAVSDVPGVRGVTPVRFGILEVDGEPQPLMVATPASLVAPIGLALESGTLDIGADELLVQRSTAEALGWQVGTVVSAEYPGGAAVSLRVAGIYADSQLVPRPYVMTPESYAPHAPGGLVHQAYVTGSDLRGPLEAALAPYPDIQLEDRTQAAARARAEVDQLLTIIVVLLALSIVIAALGIVNTLALSLVERTRELGLLRAIGMSRRHVRRMVRQESVIIAVLGATLGLTLGVGFGVALQRTLVRQGIDTLSIPWTQLTLFALTAAVIGVLASLWPAAHAARTNILRAIAME